MPRQRVNVDGGIGRLPEARYSPNLASNPFVRVERDKERDTVVISPLERLDEPASLHRLREGRRPGCRAWTSPT